MATMLALGPDLWLRPETAQDHAFAYALYAEQRRDELAALGWTEPAIAAFAQMQFRAQAAHLAATFPAADRSIVMGRDAPIGRLYVARAPIAWRLVDIAIVGAARRQGIGTRLVTWVAGEAAKAGAATLELHVAHDNHAAARFYDRLGFVAAESAGAAHRRLSLPLS